MKQKIKYSLLCILISFSLCDKSYTNIQNEIKTNNKLLKDLESSINKLEKDINSMESSKKDLSKSVDMLNQKIIYREKQIALLSKQLKNISELINNSLSKIDKEEDELRILKTKLKKRSIHLFKTGKKDILYDIILSDNWNQALNKYKYLEVLLEYEKKLNQNIKKNIENLKNDKKNLERDKKNQKNILKEAKQIRQKLDSDKKNKLKKIKEIESDKNLLTQNLNNKKKEISDIENIIKKLISDSKKAKEREEILARERARKNKSTSGNFAKMKGKLNWPTNGKIITKFGKKINAELNTVTENIGINIQTNKNAPVYSVLDGDVSVVSYLRGYGNYIVIRHGEGYFTVYANLKNIIDKEGEIIDSNTQIANVNESNNSDISNSHYLHFEIWKNESKLNPELWIKKK